jgi:N-formylglutamate deformylase
MTTPSTVLHVPHASVKVPDNVLNTFLLDGDELRQEVLRMTDWYTDTLFALPSETATTVKFPVSRLVVDPERFVDDAAEPMAGVGMGAVYTRTSSGEALRGPLSTSSRNKLLADYYAPHHRNLTQVVERSIEKHGTCLILDAHSFSSQPLPHEPDQSPHRPDICIGTDEFHTSKDLTDLTFKTFEREGWAVGINCPFSGSLVPAKFYKQTKRVRSIMIEVNRSLYMNGKGRVLCCRHLIACVPACKKDKH